MVLFHPFSILLSFLLQFYSTPLINNVKIMLLQTNKSYSSYFRSAFIFIFHSVSRETQRMFDCLESFTFPYIIL